MHTPSVLADSPIPPMPPMIDTYGMSSYHQDLSPTQSRRQRITMACQYCRHRKIRCCGGNPCRNCSRSQKECEYAPVPEEVNRATREKKAIAKAVKHLTPTTHYSPYFVDHPTFELPYPPAPSRPIHNSHRRSVSTPNFEIPAWNPPPAPALASPAVFDQPSPWFEQYPSVLEPQQPLPQPHHPSTPTTLTTSYSTPNLPQTYLRPLPLPLTPINTDTTSMSPMTPSSIYYTPTFQAQPAFYPQQTNSPSYLPVSSHSSSPTLAPELTPTKDHLVGLGIGVPQEVYHTPTFVSTEFFHPY